MPYADLKDARFARQGRRVEPRAVEPGTHAPALDSDLDELADVVGRSMPGIGSEDETAESWPAPPGQQGIPGQQGNHGIPGDEGDPGDTAPPIPGPAGAAGERGSPGPSGDDGDEGQPGPPAPSPLVDPSFYALQHAAFV